MRDAACMHAFQCCKQAVHDLKQQKGGKISGSHVKTSVATECNVTCRTPCNIILLSTHHLPRHADALRWIEVLDRRRREQAAEH